MYQCHVCGGDLINTSETISPYECGECGEPARMTRCEHGYTEDEFCRACDTYPGQTTIACHYCDVDCHLDDRYCPECGTKVFFAPGETPS